MRIVSNLKIAASALVVALLCLSCVVHRDHPKPPPHKKHHKHKKPRPPRHHHGSVDLGHADGTYYASVWYD